MSNKRNKIMCLENVTTKEPLTAEKDITVYKYLIKTFGLVINWKDLVSHGDECVATIMHNTVKGKISIEFDKLFICTNDSNCDGRVANDMLGYKYSWVFDSSITSIIVKGNEIVGACLVTPYQSSPVKIGEEYTSELILERGDVNIGLHSYLTKPIYLNKNEILTECIIPKGSKYFLGDFHSTQDSIASDKIKYVKILKINKISKFLKKIFHIK